MSTATKIEWTRGRPAPGRGSREASVQLVDLADDGLPLLDEPAPAATTRIPDTPATPHEKGPE